MDVELVLIDDLTLDPKNARRHDDKNLRAIAESLKQFGQRKPIVVWGDTVVAGNGTLVAARSLGWREILVARVPDDWDEARVMAYALADNRSAELAEWDDQVLTEQLKELELADWDVEALGFEATIEPLQDIVEDEIPELYEAKAKLGQVWKLGRHRVMCGDATDEQAVSKLIFDNKVDMVWTDPPYGIAHSGKGIEGVSQGNDFGAILGDDDVGVAIECYKLAQLLFGDATHVWWGANYYASVLPNGFGWLIWDKQREGNTFSGAEIAFVNKGIRVDVFRHQWHGMIRASERNDKRVHPTQKPIALVNFCFDNYGNPKTILDLFGGSGSTLIACEQTDRTCFMMELDPKYVDVIIARWEKLTGLTAELVEG